MPELTCPVCGGALHREERSLRCGAGHCYDLARQGYVNLLRTNRSKDKRHGDDKRMVAARTAFLDAGYYAPLRDAIAAAATEYTTGDAGVLDAGCGEGYYTAHVLHTLQAQGASPSVCGVDISRDALICAHRRAPDPRPRRPPPFAPAGPIEIHFGSLQLGATRTRQFHAGQTDGFEKPGPDSVKGRGVTGRCGQPRQGAAHKSRKNGFVDQPSQGESQDQSEHGQEAAARGRLGLPIHGRAADAAGRKTP